MKTRVNAVGWAAVVVLSASCAANLASPPAWQPAPPLNEAREAFGVVVDDFGNIYVLGGDNRTGGCSGGGSMVVTIEKLAFDPGTRTYADQWTVLPTMLPTARANFVAVIKDGFIYLIGGNLYGVPDPPVIAQVDRYDLVTGSWDSVTVPPPNTLRTDYGAVVDRQGRIWIMGGRTLPSGTPPLASTEVFDPVRPEPGWQYGPELNTGRTSCSCVMDAAGRLYAIGGYNPVTGEHISSVERLDSCVDLGCQVGRARWKLDAASREPGPPDQTLDASGCGHDGNVYGGAEQFDDYIHFDGSDDYVDVPDSIDWNFASGFTLRASVRLTDYNHDAAIVAKHVSGVNQGYFLGVTDDHIRFMVASLPNNSITTPGTYRDGLWHDVVGVFDAATGFQSLYVDGNLKVQQVAVPPYPPPNTALFRIGAYTEGQYAEKLHGDIRDVQALPYGAGWTLLDWSLPAPSIVDPRAGVGADGKIYVIGGYGSSWVNRTLRLEPDEAKWSVCVDPTGWHAWSSLQARRALHGVALGHDGFLYAIGGDTLGCVSFTSVEKLDTRRPIGDINGDSTVDFGDINPFVCILTNPPY